MTGTSPADAEAAYYQGVEEFFVSRRGDPLILSSADWVLIRDWRTAGIPLRVVLRGVADALDSHAHSWGRHRKVGSLRYCAAEVEAARERWERALSLGQEDAGNIPGALEDFARALEGARGLGPAGGLAKELAAGMRERGLLPPAPRELEGWLAASEARLLAAVREATGASALQEMEADVDQELRPYRDRMPLKVLSQVREDGLARRLLAAHGIPRLSLFLL